MCNGMDVGTPGQGVLRQIWTLWREAEPKGNGSERPKAFEDDTVP